jgi:hypothetical protein
MKKSVIIAAMLYGFAAQGMFPDRDTVDSPSRHFIDLEIEIQRLNKEIARPFCTEVESKRVLLAEKEQESENVREVLYRGLYPSFFEEWLSITRPLAPSEVGPAQRFIQFLQTQGKTIVEVRAMDAQTWIEFYFKDNPSLQEEKDRLIELSQGRGDISLIINELVDLSHCVENAPFSAEDTQRFFRETLLEAAQQSAVSRDTILALYAKNRVERCIKFQKRQDDKCDMKAADILTGCAECTLSLDVNRLSSDSVYRSLFSHDREDVRDLSGFFYHPFRVSGVCHEAGHGLCAQKIVRMQIAQPMNILPPALRIASEGFLTRYSEEKVAESARFGMHFDASLFSQKSCIVKYLFGVPEGAIRMANIGTFDVEVFQILGIGAFSYPDDPERFILIINRLSDFTASVECGIPPRCDHLDVGRVFLFQKEDTLMKAAFFAASGLLSGIQFMEMAIGASYRPVLAFWEPLFELHGCPKEVYEPWLQPWRVEQAAQS